MKAILLLVFLLLSCAQQEEEDKLKSRFEKIESFAISDESVYIGTVHRDKQTGINYLLIVNRCSHKPLAITRLWEKEDK